jgi:hypothetical protein
VIGMLGCYAPLPVSERGKRDENRRKCDKLLPPTLAAHVARIW